MFAKRISLTSGGRLRHVLGRRESSNKICNTISVLLHSTGHIIHTNECLPAVTAHKFKETLSRELNTLSTADPAILQELFLRDHGHKTEKALSNSLYFMQVGINDLWIELVTDYANELLEHLWNSRNEHSERYWE